jgi:predicted Na+-dependent transporter
MLSCEATGVSLELSPSSNGGKVAYAVCCVSVGEMMGRLTSR